MKNILLLNDFSTGEHNTVQYAVTLAQALKASLVLFCPFNVPVNAVEVPKDVNCNSYDHAWEGLLNKINVQVEVLQTLIEKTGGYKPVIRYLIKEDNILCAINQIVKNELIGLIIMGAPDPDFSSFLFSDHVSSIITLAECPVLLLPGQSKLGEIKNICFITDLLIPTGS
jgi:nucleotide-binding universal stress UspA family protein